MGSRTTFAGTIRVHYGYVMLRFGDEDLPDMVKAFAGQDNGLCGAADPRGLVLRTGLHTGEVGFTVELHDEAPPFDVEAEEIVEAPLAAPNDDAVLGGFDSGPYPCGLPKGEWRVRYSATGMDAAVAADTSRVPIDRYRLEFWPSSVQLDRVVRQTSARAAYWHECARSA